MMWEHVINMEEIKKHTQYSIGNLKGQEHIRDFGISLGTPLQMALSRKVSRCRYIKPA
jgi:hypothetical protein